MEALLAGTEELLADSVSKDSYFAQILSEYDAATQSDGSIPVSLHISADTDQLNLLKFQYIELCTQELFWDKLAASSPLDGDNLPCPSIQELSRVEIAFEGAKVNLKKLKDARTTASQQLEEACREVSDAFVDCEDARSSVAKQIQDTRAGTRLRDVTNVLENGSSGDVAKLASNVDGHDAKACEQILTHLFSELSQTEQEKSAAEAQIEALQSDIDRNLVEQSELNNMLGHYKSQLEEVERSNPEAPALREESVKRKQLCSVVSGLTRADISSINEGKRGIRIQMTVDRPVEEVRSSGEVREASPISIVYTLDMRFGDSIGNVVDSLVVTPADIATDSLVSKEDPKTVPQVVQSFIALAASTPVDELQKPNVIPLDGPSCSESSSATL